MAHKKDTYYFSHDCNARRDPKIIALRSVYGAEGYGWWWILLEILREQEDYRIDITKKFAYSSLATEMGITRDRCQEFIESCLNEFELLQGDGVFIWSESMCRRMEKFEEKRKRMSERGKKGAAATNEKKAENTAQATETAGTSEENERLSDGTSEEKAGNKRKEKVNKSKEENIGGNDDAANAAPPTDVTGLAEKQARMIEREKGFYMSLKPYLPDYGRETLRAFYDYWREPNKSRTRMRWEQERTWDLKLRLEKWVNNDHRWNKNKANTTHEAKLEPNASELQKEINERHEERLRKYGITG